MDRETIFSFITKEESAYSLPIEPVEGWFWNMKDHIKKCTLYHWSQLLSGNPGNNKPVKNIIYPILNLQYRAEGFDVKDIEIFVNDFKNYYKSFLIRKRHEQWAREQEIDTFIDEMVESYVGYGGVLVKRIKGVRPEVVPMTSISFCNQADILSRPIGIKHIYSPDQLKEFESVGWGDEANGATCTIDELITFSREEKMSGKEEKQKTNDVEIYEVHGNMPNDWLDEGEGYSNQIQIVCLTKSEDKRGGYILFRKKEKNPFKFLPRNKIQGRALGFGGIEELFDAQIWTNYSMIRMKEMLDSASKTILMSTDPTIRSKHPNGLSGMQNLEIIDVEQGSELRQVDTFPRNIQLFEKAVQDWQAHAQQTGSANDSIMGESPNSGTPFKLQELVTQENHSLHEYRKGKIATFLDTIYRDWIIPELIEDINKGSEFLADLELSELEEVCEKVITHEANKILLDKVLGLEVIQEGEQELLMEKLRQDFMKQGKKRFLKVIKNELEKSPLGVKTNIAGKQKYLAQHTEKLVNIVRQIISAPQMMDDPRLSKMLNDIMESSGLSPIDFSQKPKGQPAQGQPTPSPIPQGNLETNNLQIA
jgi:hypothetical protein